MKNRLYFVAVFGIVCQIASLAALLTADNGETIQSSLIVFLTSGFIAGGALILEKLLRKDEKPDNF
jgi:uncharacterized membrane protein